MYNINSEYVHTSERVCVCVCVCMRVCVCVCGKLLPTDNQFMLMKMVGLKQKIFKFLNILQATIHDLLYHVMMDRLIGKSRIGLQIGYWY